MDNHHLRSIILKLQDRLSDNDRKRLHFFLANDVPRRIRDDPTLSGTLNLMESLFDQEKISEQDFTFLIDVFTQIQCRDAVKLLKASLEAFFPFHDDYHYAINIHQTLLIHMCTISFLQDLFLFEIMSLRNTTPSSRNNISIPSTTFVSVRIDHKKRMQSIWLSQPTLTSVIPSLNAIIIDQEDDNASPLIINPMNNYGHNNKIMDSNNTNINPVTINVDNKILSSSSKHNPLSFISFKMNKCFFFIVSFLAMILGILLIVWIIKINENIGSDRKLRKEIMQEEQKKQNKTMIEDVLEKNEQIAKLNNQITELEKEKENSLVKAGRKFGGTDGIFFDDSFRSDFTCSHYLNGLIIRHDDDGLESYQFFYRSSSDSRQELKSQFHGNEEFVKIDEHKFDENEKINKVEGQIVKKIIVLDNGTNITKVLITGIQFSSTEDHASHSYDGPLGTSFSESFDGYTLGYVTGRADQYIEQIQFFWYRI